MITTVIDFIARPNRSIALFSRMVPMSSLAVFRIFFGLTMLFSVVRFWYYGWIEDLYIKPDFHFSYIGFSWVKPLSGSGMYFLFAMVGISSFMVALGLFYRFAIVTFWFAFTWIELIDVTVYLNHYYFVSLVSLVLCFSPAHARYSIDCYREGRSKYGCGYGFQWPLVMLRFQVAITYFFAGVAKLNSDWLLDAQPLRTWLRMWTHLPWIGRWISLPEVALAGSWGAAAFDLILPCLLFSPKFRGLAFCALIVFHVVTGMLFNIGVFPVVMIGAATLFFEPNWPERLRVSSSTIVSLMPATKQKLKFLPVVLIGLYLGLQIVLPLRHWLYPGSTAWTEQGFRFSWNVMRIEKTGMIDFHLTDPVSGQTWVEYPSRYLSMLQHKAMTTQPDLILQFAHFLADESEKRIGRRPEVRADSWVSLNSRSSQRFVDSRIDLAQVEVSFANKDWILPLTE